MRTIPEPEPHPNCMSIHFAGQHLVLDGFNVHHACTDDLYYHVHMYT
ncbi:hypothetical protein AVEN_104845-1, partial [Araneus ventricosus]